ncbi:uncharacterized protein LOC113854663 [Abrus precatorius]|uniref:Uncharacterized protein LOC113854663 n=1 Tax=Abrus precatorius TaxID=3816 RepID=A0A8B8KCU8_ABRPR|nr:uncharacterized protein LOC113854663 [Abrus precatorius]
MSFGGLSIVLSLVFGCLLLALVAQLYYFLWWKKRRTHVDVEMDHGNYAKGLFHWGCLKTPFNMHATNIAGSLSKDPETTSHEADLESGEGKDLLHKSFGEEGVECELMRLHNLAGPPRFLFPIKEETKEDLESEDGKSRWDRSRKGSRTRSLSDIMLAIDTPFLTPVASSPLKCPLDPLDSYKHQGFNPLFESSAELEFNRFRSSPPPKFKFLRDAEEKLHRKLVEEARRKALENHGSIPENGAKDSRNETMATDFTEGSFLRLIQNKDPERKQLQQYLPQFPSGSSQVLPLPSSPPTFRPLDNASLVH